MKREGARALVALERGESAREPARLLGALFSPAAVRVRALHVAPVTFPLSYLSPGLESMDSLRREQLIWEQREGRVLVRQVEPLEDAGFEVETEATSGSALAEIRKRALKSTSSTRSALSFAGLTGSA